MQHPFISLKPEIERRLAAVKITRAAAVDRRAEELAVPKVVDRFAIANSELKIPIVWMIASFERESGSDFSKSPAQGDPWNKKSTHVPRGSGPFRSFDAAALWSYRHDGIDKLPAGQEWSMAYACYAWERFNGFGPRDRGRVSGYVFSGTNQYDPPTGLGGKYVEDGIWSPGTVDKQLGCLSLALRMIEIMPALAMLMPAPAPSTPTDVIPDVLPVPDGHGGGTRGTTWIQNTLNLLQIAGTPLLVDGSYGRRTAAAIRAFQHAYGLEIDGICGPKTISALETALAAWKAK